MTWNCWLKEFQSSLHQRRHKGARSSSSPASVAATCDTGLLPQRALASRCWMIRRTFESTHMPPCVLSIILWDDYWSEGWNQYYLALSDFVFGLFFLRLLLPLLACEPLDELDSGLVLPWAPHSDVIGPKLLSRLPRLLWTSPLPVFSFLTSAIRRDVLGPSAGQIEAAAASLDSLPVQAEQRGGRKTLYPHTALPQHLVNASEATLVS